MRSEFLVTNSSNDSFLLYTKQNFGLFLRRNTVRASRDEILYEKCSDNIDVCMNKNGNIYILCQSEKGNIICIQYKDGAWHKFDLLIPKSGKNYAKKFFIDSFDDSICGFYNVTLDNKNMLCAHNIKEKVPAALAELSQEAPIFDGCKISDTTSALVFLDKDNTLCIRAFDVKNNKSAWYTPFISGNGIKSINICFIGQKLHMVFNRDGGLFYICMDVITKVQQSMFDLGSISDDDQIVLSPSKKDLKIYIINKDEIFINSFDTNGKSLDYKTYDRIKEEIVLLKTIFENVSIIYPSIIVNRQHVNLYNSLNKTEGKDEDLEQKLLELTRQIEDVKNKMRQ